jgi:hypothetical protein
MSMNTHENQMGAGESATSIRRALSQMKYRVGRDGMWHIDGVFQPAVAAPLFRALTRIEAELLLHDADHISAAQLEPPRTVERRRADALVALAVRVGDAFPT